MSASRSHACFHAPARSVAGAEPVAGLGIRVMGSLLLAAGIAGFAPEVRAQTTAPVTTTAPEARPADVPAMPPAMPATTEAAPAAKPAGVAPTRASAELRLADGTPAGTAMIEDTASGMMHVTLTLSGLPEGVKATHIHGVGQCEGNFDSAGGHLTGAHEHGAMVANGPHTGDLPNLHVPASGALTVEAFRPDAKVAEVLDADGGAIIVHAKADDYTSQPAGDAGGRIACGVFAPVP